MPNTPAQIGEGITVWTASPSVKPDQFEIARKVLQALGEEIFMEEERYLDMATALSGTGPAYVFIFMEALIDAGVHLGFPRRIAERLVTQTIRGSVRIIPKTEMLIPRNCVTKSPLLAGPRLPPCITWKKLVSARLCHAQFGPRMSIRKSWARVGM